jgi:2-(3-amino-3-carboxypropyl)histidine synthase
MDIVDELDCEVIISGSHCYGACDINEKLLRKVDLLIHFGHYFPSSNPKILFIECRSKIDVSDILERAISELSSERIGILTNIQHIHTIPLAKKILRKNGKIPMVSRKKSRRVRYSGQILGCDFSAARVPCDEFLYIGSGDFHPLGASFFSGKNVVVADPYLEQVRSVDTDRILKKRYGMVSKAMDFSSFGIILSTKPGQARKNLAEKLSREAKKYGKNALIVAMDEVIPELLLSFDFDAWVNTACPRIPFDERWEKPVLTPQEFEILLGIRKDYVWDEIR